MHQTFLHAFTYPFVSPQRAGNPIVPVQDQYLILHTEDALET